MAAPRMNPSGFFEVTSSARMEGKLELFGYGQHDKAISPGDLVIVTTQYMKDGFKNQEIQASLKLRGRDMHLFVAAAAQALALWEENSEWLQAPASKPSEAVADPRSPIAALTHYQQAAMRAV
jgi:hypothetical protein